MGPGVQIAATFDPEKMRVLDNRGESVILVRGNAPINRRGDFDPDMVVRHAQRKFAAESSDTSRTVFDRVVVISLISARQSDEERVLRKQRRHFLDNKTTEHQLHHRPIVGSWIPPIPFKNFDFLNRLIWNAWRPDDGAWDLARELKDLLDESSPDGTIVYFHCMRGIDRTGLVAGAYLARRKAASGAANEGEIDRINRDVAKRDINWPAQNALRWVLWKSRRSSSE